MDWEVMGIPTETDHAQFCTKKITDTGITVENIRPQFKSEEARSKAKGQIMRILYEVFSKYEENS